MDEKEFKSLTLDLEKKKYELNGESMKGISNLELSFENGEWSLRITKDIIFRSTKTSEIRE